MVRTVQTFPVPALGVGRPDYQGETWQARTLKRLELHENEMVKSFVICATPVFSPWIDVVPPLAVGASAYLIDFATGLPMPFVVTAGYELEVMLVRSTFNQNHRLFEEYEGFLLGEYHNEAMNVYYENEVFELSTKMTDPHADFSHVVAFGGTNVGLDVMRGSAEVICILRRIHTEMPTTKTIRCKWCGNTKEVAHDTVKWNCTKCGKLNLYMHLPSTLIEKGGRK